MDILPVVSLCAGGGGLEAGISRTLPGADVQTVLHVERETVAAAYLASKMESNAMAPAPIWSSVERLPEPGWRELRDLAAGSLLCLSAGFPCQPWSVAGTQKGQEDERWLWPSIDGWIRAIRPGVVFLENVPALASRGGIGPVAATLAREGYLAGWDLFRACEAAAPHKRERLFLVAVLPHAHCHVLRLLPERGRGPTLEAQPRQRRRELRKRVTEAGRAGLELANCDSQRCRGKPEIERQEGNMEEQSGNHPDGFGYPTSPFPPGPNDWDAWAQVEASGRWWLRPALPRPLIESALCLLADGVGELGRPHLLRMAGNGVVPDQAALAYTSILRNLERTIPR